MRHRNKKHSVLELHFLGVNTSTQVVYPSTPYPSKTRTSSQNPEDTKSNEDEKTKYTQCRVSHRLGE